MVSQCARATHGLGGGHAAGGDQLAVGTEQQLASGLGVGGQAVDRQVAARTRVQRQLLLDAVDGAQQRDAAVLVVVDAHAEVDLGRAGVGVVGLGQAQDRIAWNLFHVCKEGHGGTRL